MDQVRRLGLVALIIAVLFVTSTPATEFRYTNGTLPCQKLNATFFDCCCRALKLVPPLSVNIKYIDLSKNKISRILEDNFDGLKALVDVDLSFNKLDTIAGTPFHDLHQLESLNLYSSSIDRLYSTSFTGLHNLTTLLMRNNQLKNLPEGVFKDLINLRVLDLSYNQLGKIPNRALLPLISIEYLNLYGNSFLTFTFEECFLNFKNLTSLYVSSTIFPDHRRVHLGDNALSNLAHCSISEFDIFFTYNFSLTVGDNIFWPLSQLTTLATGYQWQNAVLSVNSTLRYISIFLAPENLQITNESLKVLSKFYTSLEILDISYSEAIGIFGPAFAEFTNLRVLNVSRMVYSLQFILPEAFEGLQNLEELYLSYDQINKLPWKAFKTFQNGKLKVLDLSYNSLTAFTVDDSFDSLSSLTHLNLSNNPIWSIGKWIHKLTKLEELKLSSLTSPYYLELYLWTSQLPSLRCIDFKSPHKKDTFWHEHDEDSFRLSKVAPNVETLSFAFAYIYSIEFITRFKYLKSLDVSGSFNHFKDFESAWGSNASFPQLRVLTSMYNQIKEVDRMNLSRTTPNLIELDLTGNLIDSLHGFPSDILSQLQKLVLSRNRIYTLSGTLDLRNVYFFDVSLNMISEIPQTFFDAVNDSLQILDANGNPYSCTCDIIPFQNWFRDNTNVVMVPGSQYKCKTPEGLQGESIMEVTLTSFECTSHPVLYTTISLVSVVLFVTLTLLVMKYWWHIKYRYFILKYTLKRKCRPRQNEEQMNLNKPKYDAFISYAHDNDRDLNWVLNDLSKNLEDGPDPLQLCIGHARDFVPGGSLLETITEAIHDSRKTIIVLSPSYLDSEWCYFETQHAWLRLLNEDKDVIIMVLLDPIPDCKMTMWLRQFLCKKKYLKWPSDKSAQNMFFRCLREMLKTPTTVDRRYDV